MHGLETLIFFDHVKILFFVLLGSSGSGQREHVEILSDATSHVRTTLQARRRAANADSGERSHTAVSSPSSVNSLRQAMALLGEDSRGGRQSGEEDFGPRDKFE